MQAQEYMMRGKEMVDFIQQYLTQIRERRVVPDVQPGFMRPLLPSSAPYEPEDWSSIMKDVENIILPGVVHWQSPHMHAYFPALTSWPSLLGDMLADAINCLGFTWVKTYTHTQQSLCQPYTSC
uniref:Histidine decarboxylase n=1 Tax=Sinocyclocheilus grahami TaxID=75366 RepID=A0A672P0L9_SINGR